MRQQNAETEVNAVQLLCHSTIHIWSRKIDRQHRDGSKTLCTQNKVDEKNYKNQLKGTHDKLINMKANKRQQKNPEHEDEMDKKFIITTE